MLQRSFFHLGNDDLNRLSPSEAVATFSELLWAEAASIGIAKNLINVPSAINVKDGGIDAEVKDVTITGGQGIIKPGLNRYQIKTGPFSLDGDAKIKEVLFNHGGSLKPRIKSCLDAGGRLVVVLFGWDNPDSSDSKSAIASFRRILKGIHRKYGRARIEVWRQNNLASYLSAFPSLCLRIAGHDHPEIRSHRSWSRDSEMQKAFSPGAPQNETIHAIQEELRKGDEARHVRVWGEPGIGKTRLALEATGTADMAPLVIYCNASKFRDSALMNELLKEDVKYHVVLVLDECDTNLSSNIWDRFKFRGPQIKIVSIYNECDETSGNIRYLQAPPLERIQLENILKSYEVPLDYADRWVDICSGSPRVAHVIGSNLRNNPGDILRPADTSDLWERYVVGLDNAAAPQVQCRRVVLRHLALFKRFGYVDPVDTEGKAIAKIIAKADRTITWAKFQETVEQLRKRRILQGEHTLYITPKALHLWLWGNWWDIHASGFRLDAFRKALPASLLESFHEMFRYAEASEAARRVVTKLLGPGGPFTDGYIKTKNGAHLFLALAEADPESALKCLRRTVGTWDKRQLRLFTERRDIVWALDQIVQWKDLFLDGARLLLALAEAENEQWANNAGGVFADLFSPAWGKVAPTELPPIDRVPLIREALSSDSPERRLLGIRACDHALEAGQFFRRVASRPQGLSRVPQLWTPQTWGEVFDYYRVVWSLLEESFHKLPNDEKSQALDILLKRSVALLFVENVAPTILDTLERLPANALSDRTKLLKSLSSTLHFRGESLAGAIRDRLMALYNDLAGSDFSSHLKRYVGMSLLTDDYDEHGNQAGDSQSRIADLARQAVGNPQALQAELGWLTTKEAENGFQFGFELARKDTSFRLLPKLIKAQSRSGDQGTAYFLGGYFNVMAQENRALWEDRLDRISKDKHLQRLIPELTWRSAVLTSTGSKRILRLAQRSALKPSDFGIFNFGGNIRSLDESSFKDWVKYFLGTKDKIGSYVLLNLYHAYYVFDTKRPIPSGLTYKVLTQPALMEDGEGNRNNMADYVWAEIGCRLLEQHPAKALPLAHFMLEHFGADGTIFDRFNSEPDKLLATICRKHPVQLWGLAVKYLDQPLDSRAFRIGRWLQQTLSSIPREDIWAWIDEDVEKRAKRVATFAPKTEPQPEGGALTRDLLVRYGNRDDVRRGLKYNLQSEGWMGSAVAHYTTKRDRLVALLKQEDNENVRKWLNEYIDDVNLQIERSKIQEERDDFHNPPV
jgi:hypothetical protein